MIRARLAGMPSPLPSHTPVEIGAIADAVESYRSRVTGIAESLVGRQLDDLLGALHEAERSLRGAHRALRRALDLSR
jgi:hypothetical protein